MLKTLPPKTPASENIVMAQPKIETLNAILNFSRSLEVRKVKNKKIYIINN